MKHPDHLQFEDMVKGGSYYTPPRIVQLVGDLVEPYVTPKSIIVDTSAGFASFFELSPRFLASFMFFDIDPVAVDYMKEMGLQNVSLKNSLLNVNRKSFNIDEDAPLIIVGNPPYNDTTSKSKKKIKMKTELEMDDDLLARDLGLSFLRSYDKLKADWICVLHPFSYLLKETNFQMLKTFKDHYRLKDSILISSGEFTKTGAVKFPIAVSLYEKDKRGMTYEFIKEFDFKIDQKNDKLKINHYHTSDPFIRKYPPTKKDQRPSNINLYFYPFRDINSLRVSKTFIFSEQNESNRYIRVDLDDFYKYAYLDAFKKFFPNDYVFGNFSPIIPSDFSEKSDIVHKSILYALHTNREVMSGLTLGVDKFIKMRYNADRSESGCTRTLEADLQDQFTKLARK